MVQGGESPLVSFKTFFPNGCDRMNYNIIEISEMIDQLQDFACNDEQIFYCGGIVGTEIFRYVTKAALLTLRKNKQIMFIDGCQDNVVIHRKKSFPINYVYYRDLFIDVLSLSTRDTFSPQYDPVSYSVTKFLDKNKFFGIDAIIINNAQLMEYEYLQEILKSVNCKVFVISDPFDVGGLPFSVYPTLTDSLLKQTYITSYARHLYGVDSSAVDKRIKCGIVKIKLAKRSYGRMDSSQHVTNNSVILEEVNNRQIMLPFKKNQKFIITDDRSDVSYDIDLKEGVTNFHRGSLITLENRQGDAPTFRLHNSQLCRQMFITYKQTSEIYAGTSVIPANMISVEDAVFHRFRDTTFVFDTDSPLDISSRYSIIKNTNFLKLIEI